MKLVFISNYFNHHQKELSEHFYRMFGEYKFLKTGKMREERRLLGYSEDSEPNYVQEYRGESVRNSDVIICGGAAGHIVRHPKKCGSIVFHYSERPLKTDDSIWKYIPRFLKLHYGKWKSQYDYLLCASAYAAYDYSKFAMYRNRAYKWGYFPETKYYDEKQLLNHKVKNRILWCGRFLDWKHPDDVIEVARRLRKENYQFEIRFVGNGILEEQLKKAVKEDGLEEYISFLGAMKPEQVRQQMEETGIFLVTSDRQEGWGAVLNEAMNSGCAVVASHAIGSVPYLVKDLVNGLIYHSGNVDMLFRKVKYLLDSIDEQERLGREAYKTIAEVWNAKVAAERFEKLVEEMRQGVEYPDLFESGPCSRAEIIKDNWFYE